MTDIIDRYGDFIKERYYYNEYEVFPSELKIEMPLESKKENIELALELLDLKSYQLEEIRREWKTTSYQDENNSYYPNYLFYKSNSKSLCVEITFFDKELSLCFLYNNKDVALGERLKETYEKIRAKLGKPKGSVFKVLSYGGGGFYTEDVSVDDFEVDTKRYYNDDFEEVNEIIMEAVEKDVSGLILLYGTPGTGKTSYIKHLMNKHQEVNFIFVQNDFVSELLKPDFISFLIKNKNSILIIEDAEKVLKSREKENENSVVSTILQLTDGLFSDYLNIKIICTFNTSISNIDDALLRKGRMIAFYEFLALNEKKVATILNEMGVEAERKEMTLAEIFNINKKEFGKINKTKKIGFN